MNDTFQEKAESLHAVMIQLIELENGSVRLRDALENGKYLAGIEASCDGLEVIDMMQLILDDLSSTD